MNLPVEFNQFPTGTRQTVTAISVQVGVANTLNLQERFLSGKVFLGSKLTYWFRTNGGQLAQLPSTAFFCCLCGEVWGRRILQPENWVTEDRLCLAHGDGSLLFDTEYEGFETYPRDLVLYELMLATKDLV